MINNTFEINSEEYFKKENFNSELKNIIQNFWIFICPSMFLVKKNDFFVFKGLGKNIVIKRIGDDKVVVFDNYCKHRGHQIHDKYFGNEETRCPYHGWLYDEDLKLSSLPWNEKCYHINKDSIQLDASVKIKQEDGVIWGYFGDKTNLSDIQYPAKKVSKELKAFESLSSESRSFVISQKKFHWRLIFDNLYDRVHPFFLHRNSIATKVNLNFESHPNDFSMEGVEDYLLSNFDHIGNSKNSNAIGLDKNIETMEGDEYLNGHIYPFLHFLTPDGGKTFNYESYIPVDEYTTIVMNFRFVGKKVSKSQHTSFLNEYLSFGSIVLNEDSRAVEYVTEVGKYNKILTYGAHEKPAVGLINLGKKKMNILITAHPYLYASILSSFKSLKMDVNEINLQLVDNYNYESISIKPDPDNTYYFFGNGAFNNYGRIKVFSELMAVGIKPQAFFHSMSMVHESVKVAIGSAIYSNTIIEENTSIGFNTIVAPNVVISKNVSIGNNCFIGPNSIIEEGVSIESNSYITSGCKLNEKIKIGKDVVIRDSRVIAESITTGTIIDSSIGDFVQIIR